MKEKIELLQKVDLFSSLKPEEIAIISKYSEYSEYEKGSCVFREGSEGDELYIIKKGEVSITKNDSEGEETELARFIQGECFGELDLIDDVPRSATAIAVEPSLLLIFPVRNISFQEILVRHPQIFAPILHKILVKIAGRIRKVNKLLSEKTPWVQDLKKKLLTDSLTGLNNNTYLQEEFKEQIISLKNPVSFIMVKPDNFKSINDLYGHKAGDKTLQVMAGTLRCMFKGDEILVRYRGDEYGVILPATDGSNARIIAESILKAFGEISLQEVVHETDQEYKTEIKIKTSAGIAVYPEQAGTGEELVALAFKRMFEARDSGGNRII